MSPPIVDNWTSTRQLVDGFEIIQLPDLLHYSYLSRHGRCKARELYIRSREKLATITAKTYAKQLVDDAEGMEAVSENLTMAWTDGTKCMLKDIKTVLGVKFCYPFLIAAHRRYQNVPAEFEQHVRAMMNFAFRYVKVLEGSIESLSAIVSDASLMVNDGTPIGKIRDLFRVNAPDAQFKTEFETVSFQSTKLAYFVVYCLERVQMNGAVPLPHGLDQNLEHIMPKTPTAAAWPIGLAQKTANPEIFKDYLWRVGNLLPLPASINKAIKNREIGYKINNMTANHYNAPGLGLQSPQKVAQFLDNGQWSFKSIEDRQKVLANTYAVKAWEL